MKGISFRIGAQEPTGPQPSTGRTAKVTKVKFLSSKFLVALGNLAFPIFAARLVGLKNSFQHVAMV